MDHGRAARGGERTPRAPVERALALAALALVGPLAAAACGDAVPEPVVDTEVPIFDSVTIVAGDSTAVIEGVASDDQRLLTIDWYLSRYVRTNGVTTALDLIRHEILHVGPQQRARFRIVTPALPADGYPFWLQVHDDAGRDTWWTATIAIGPATPSVRLRAVGGDTVRGLAALLDAAVAARRPIVRVDLIRGDGALLDWTGDRTSDDSRPFQRVSGVPLAGGLLLPLAPAPTGAPMRVTLRAIDDSGRVGTSTVTFVHDLPDAPYLVTFLGPASSRDGEARALNDRGDVVGTVTGESGAVGVVWRAAAGTPVAEPLGAPGDSVADPVAINEAGTIAGTLRSRGQPSCGRATVWPVGGAPRPAAPTIPPCSALFDINDRGDVLGLQGTAINPAFVTRGDTLFAVTSVSSPLPVAIGSSGLAVGTELTSFARPPRTHTDAVAWLPGRLGLPCFASLASAFEACRAVDLNELGQILGSAAGEPVLWQPGPRLVPLAPKLYGTSPVGLNDRGHVLAYRASDSTAFVLRDSVVVRVRPTDAAWTVDRVTAINAAGQIAGHATERGTGRRGAVLLTPVR
jgi:hypothetical protein